MTGRIHDLNNAPAKLTAPMFQQFILDLEIGDTRSGITAAPD